MDANGFAPYRLLDIPPRDGLPLRSLWPFEFDYVYYMYFNWVAIMASKMQMVLPFVPFWVFCLVVHCHFSLVVLGVLVCTLANMAITGPYGLHLGPYGLYQLY